jgi:hypothetical protein
VGEVISALILLSNVQIAAAENLGPDKKTTPDPKGPGVEFKRWQ